MIWGRCSLQKAWFLNIGGSILGRTTLFYRQIFNTLTKKIPLVSYKKQKPKFEVGTKLRLWVTSTQLVTLWTLITKLFLVLKLSRASSCWVRYTTRTSQALWIMSRAVGLRMNAVRWSHGHFYDCPTLQTTAKTTIPSKNSHSWNYSLIHSNSVFSKYFPSRLRVCEILCTSQPLLRPLSAIQPLKSAKNNELWFWNVGHGSNIKTFFWFFDESVRKATLTMLHGLHW